MVEDLAVDLILQAYGSGIFPMGDDDGSISWYSPDPRCIIDLQNFHASSRLLRKYHGNLYEIRVNTAWDEVLRACASRQTTWINEEIIAAYTKLHQLEYAHSVEAFLGDQLVGGLYGVSIGGAFMGESMFHTATDASKICLVFLVERLRQRGFSLLDCQYMNEHLRQFGAVLISREEYLQRLEQAVSLDCHFV
jgi:leucyl/phenylalanyl-tRNA--protein transferase